MARNRDNALDIARGLIMALMALDHTRMYFASAQFDPVAIEHTTVGYFITRWVTHLCAPGFFFLAGLGVSLAERAGLPPAKSTFRLVTRGLWLIALELTIIGFAWAFHWGWSWFGVIWSLGACMVLLGVLRWIPKPVLTFVGLVVVIGHNSVVASAVIPDEDLRALLYSAGLVQTPFGPKIALFPIIPWLAIMVLGYALGGWFTPERKASAIRFGAAGAGALAVFLITRASRVGQPLEGGPVSYNDLVQTAMSFFNVEKYPPSLQFTSVTLGVFFLGVAAFSWMESDRAPARPFEPLLKFGRVPFFFYVLHLYLIHTLAFLATSLFRWPTDFLFWSRAGPNLTPPDGYGFELWGVYAVWLVVLALLYLPCAWFGALKSKSRSWWTRYV